MMPQSVSIQVEGPMLAMMAYECSSLKKKVKVSTGSPYITDHSYIKSSRSHAHVI